MKEKIDDNWQMAREKAGELAEAAGKSIKKSSRIAGKQIKIGSKFVGRKLQEGQVAAKELAEETKLEYELKTLRPVFKHELTLSPQGLSSEDIPYNDKTSKIIYIGDKDKKRQDSPVCEGSVGHLNIVRDTRILNLYEENLNELEYIFFPHVAHTIYYADPYQENFYISLDDYFDYLQKARVNELEAVAYKLGAKRVQISFKEHKKTFVAIKAGGNIKGKTKMFGRKPNIEGVLHHEHESSEYSKIEIAADVKFSGHNTPVEPELRYFKGVSDIERLIKMRMSDSTNKIESKIYKFQCSRLSGISFNEALKIDAALAHMKISGTASVSSEVQREGRTDLEYSIEF